MINILAIKSKKQIETIDITNEVRKVIKDIGVREGICTIFVPHTTAGITINEGADPDVMRDFIDKLDELFPLESGYLHAEGNSAAHIKTSIVGSSVHIMVDKGEPVLGTWQSVFFCEFDGPRERKVQVKVIES